MTPKSPAPGNVELEAMTTNDLLANYSTQQLADIVWRFTHALTPSEDAMAESRGWLEAYAHTPAFRDVTTLATLLQSAEARGIERAAKVADKYAKQSSNEMNSCEHCTDDYHQAYGATMEAGMIAAAIRALIGKS